MTGRGPVIALLLVGGAGTRLWPISNSETPKQFLKLFEDRSLFQATLARISLAEVDDIVVVTSATDAQTVSEQVAEIGLRRPHLLLEPTRRDSAAAISAGVVWIQQKFGADSSVAVLPSDHYIPDPKAFTRALERAATLAADGWLVTFGIRPTFPATEYGYIQRGAPIAGSEGGHKVEKFHEKPSREAAEAYIGHGGYDWNAGIFVFTAGAFAKEALHHMPDIWQPSARAVEAANEGSVGWQLNAEAFSSARKSSIDYALFEKSDRVAVIPVSFAWHDIGNWASAYDAFKVGSQANLVIGDALLDDVSGALVVADRVKVVVCGLEDVVVVSSPEGTFVAPRSRAAEIKRLLSS